MKKNNVSITQRYAGQMADAIGALLNAKQSYANVLNKNGAPMAKAQAEAERVYELVWNFMNHVEDEELPLFETE